MAIREFEANGVHRAKIGFFDARLTTSDDLSRFKERKFECVDCTEHELRDPEFVASLDAVIFSQNPQRRQALVDVLSATVALLLNNDVRVYIRIAPEARPYSPEAGPYSRKVIVDSLLQLNVPLANLREDERQQVPKMFREREGAMLAPSIYLFDSGVGWTDIANIVCDHPAGKAPNRDLLPDGCDRSLLDADKQDEGLLLLQRAFCDCKSLHLQPMADGLSGAPVYKAYAAIEPGLAGDWPYLHFVKIGSRKKISDEYHKYIGRAVDYVPFHLGPRLRLERCNLGSSLGILVGDFVEGAEPIRDAAPAGRAGHAVANLFDKTLGAWRKQSQFCPTQILGDVLGPKWLDEKTEREIELPAGRMCIVEKLGGDINVSTLRAFFEAHSGIEVRCCPSHGDLHATNVLVRGGDAIIIDFEKMQDAFPLLYDPASLEGGLLVDGFRHDVRAKERPEELLESISPLYQLDVLRGFVSPCHAVDPCSWYYDCVSQIRTLSKHADPAGQYALVLALCLIRKGCSWHQFETAQENLRAISFVLGQRILAEIDRVGLNV